jgi:hypothetical protein
MDYYDIERGMREGAYTGGIAEGLIDYVFSGDDEHITGGDESSLVVSTHEYDDTVIVVHGGGGCDENAPNFKPKVGGSDLKVDGKDHQTNVSYKPTQKTQFKSISDFVLGYVETIKTV